MMGRLLTQVFSTGLCLVAAASAHATVMLGTAQQLFNGVSLQTVQVDGSQGFVATINLTASGVRITGSAPAAAGVTIPGTTPPVQAETVAQTTSQFLISSGTQYAVNAGFFSPCCNTANEGKDITGLTISDGVIVSPIAPGGGPSLVITTGNAAYISLLTSIPADGNDVFTGSDLLVSNGVNVAPTASTSFNNANPRTAAGVSRDGRTLYLLTIDGRQLTSPGTSLVQTASVFVALGADSALNLDGGGSTAAVVSNGAGGATLLNHPSAGTERYDAASIGVFALALPTSVPEPASLLLLTAVLAGFCVMRRRA